MTDLEVRHLIRRIRLGHEANAGFHLSADEMEALLDAAERGLSRNASDGEAPRQEEKG